MIACDATRARCACVLRADHDGPHECDPEVCGGSWTYDCHVHVRNVSGRVTDFCGCGHAQGWHDDLGHCELCPAPDPVMGFNLVTNCRVRPGQVWMVGGSRAVEIRDLLVLRDAGPSVSL